MVCLHFMMLWRKKEAPFTQTEFFSEQQYRTYAQVHFRFRAALLCDSLLGAIPALRKQPPDICRYFNQYNTAHSAQWDKARQ